MTGSKISPQRRSEAAFKIGGAIIAIGLFFAVSQISKPYVIRAIPGAGEELSVDTPISSLRQNSLQVAVDGSPGVKGRSWEATASPDAAAIPVPSKKPVLVAERKKRRAETKRVLLEDEIPQGVQRFDHCKPACETMDPLIVSHRNLTHSAESLPLAVNATEKVTDPSPVRLARDVLARAVDVPRAVLRTGQTVFQRFVD
jgi:hypothetical protein